MGRPKPLKTKPRVIFLLFLVTVLNTSYFFYWRSVSAQELTNRSISVSSGQPSAVTTHSFRFTPTSLTNIGSIAFQYCENTPVFGQPCDAPVGMDLTTAILASQTGNIGFSFDTVNTTANRIVLTRSPAAALAVTSSYTFNNVTNPSNAPHSEFIQISTYASTDGSGSLTDNGAVAYAIHNPLNVAAYIPPFLTFCVGVTVAVDCSTINGDSIDLGIISRSAANYATSQFSTATNDPTGYIIYSLGNTMTSGNNVIPAISSPTPSLAGSGQFGINLRSNSAPPVGQEPFGVGTGVPVTNYNFPNFYMFNDGDSIASSALSSYYTRMTVSYLINAPSSQPPGVYSTTLTYMATVQF